MVMEQTATGGSKGGSPVNTCLEVMDVTDGQLTLR